MWRDGFDPAFAAWVLNALALVFGAVLGGRALIDPNWAAKLVRLKPDEQGGGFAEFRATYGGLFLAAHAVALYFTLRWLTGGQTMVGIYAAGAAAVLSAAWIGTAGGRAFSMWRDDTRTRFNEISVGVEFVTGVLIGSPWLLWSMAN